MDRRSLLLGLGIAGAALPTRALAAGTSAPWIVYGQTAATGGQVINPTPSTNGSVLGEVAALPYYVPAGKVLHIRKVGIEGLWGATLWPFVGGGALQQILMTYNAAERTPIGDWQNANSTYVWNADHHIKPGSTFGLSLAMQSPVGALFGWFVSGRLIDASEFS